ncbi:hypothetical protein [Aeoliella mucimassa]|uniref:Uncharacterized protein n=1 Tax=Aeoliella mucimassa TaxID=2527972 RepID=A0A518AQT7_9BACT|nr:hypothetical protein [Aeoliella mucimassa]QDU57087.1 hypothetical protein Pan181_33010 [Aeoliella mucimassa]
MESPYQSPTSEPNEHRAGNPLAGVLLYGTLAVAILCVGYCAVELFRDLHSELRRDVVGLHLLQGLSTTTLITGTGLFLHAVIRKKRKRTVIGFALLVILSLATGLMAARREALIRQQCLDGLRNLRKAIEQYEESQNTP